MMTGQYYGAVSIGSSSSSSSSSASTIDWQTLFTSTVPTEVTSLSEIDQGHSCLGGIYLYCTVKRTASYSADITEYETEAKNYISDTVLRQPLTIELTVFESNMPANSVQVKYLSKMTSRVVSVKEKLIELADNGTVMELVTPDDVYENMVITSMSFPEDDYLNAMEITVNLRQISFTEAEDITDEDNIDYESVTEETVESITAATEAEEALSYFGVDLDSGISVDDIVETDFGGYADTGEATTGQYTYINTLINAAVNGLLEDMLFINPNYGAEASGTTLYVYYNGYFYATPLASKGDDESDVLNLYYDGYTIIGEGKTIWTSKYYKYYTSLEDYLGDSYDDVEVTGGYGGGGGSAT